MNGAGGGITGSFIRGGAWSRTEDQIVTAAVQKYGLTQWARVASLLNRRSAAQCKARWFEYLDPGLKKHSWNDKDDARLLELARRLPNMWRTIAPMMGRSSQACLDRYNYLISGRNDELSVATEESKPARDGPKEDEEDALGSDEETEMLAEARARLANSLGKKAKRKLREKIEAQEKRLKMLEDHRRDNTGIKFVRSKFAVDYNAEVPFEIEAGPGPFDTTAEDASDAAKVRNRETAIAKGKKFKFGHEPLPTPKPVRSRRRELELPVLAEPNQEPKRNRPSKSEIKHVAALLAQLPAPLYPTALEDLPATPPDWGEFAEEEDTRPSAVRQGLCRATVVIDTDNDELAEEVQHIIHHGQRVSQAERDAVNELIDAELKKGQLHSQLEPEPQQPITVVVPGTATNVDMYMRRPEPSAYNKLQLRHFDVAKVALRVDEFKKQAKQEEDAVKREIAALRELCE